MPEDLLVGNLAISVTVLKAIISSLKQVMKLSDNMIRVISLLAGIPIALLLDIEVFSLTENAATISVIFNKILTGFFVGSMVMGVHEATKLASIPNVKKS